MIRIVLIRPGATDFDEQRRIQGTLDIPLSAKGNLEVARAIEHLQDAGMEALYCSECEPARETAEAIANATGLRIKNLDNMQNLNHGLWQGMLVDEIKRKHPKVYRQWQEQPENVCPPEGETIDGARARVRAALKKLLKRHKDGVIGLVVPEPLASLVRSYLQGSEVRDLWPPSEDHGSWEVIEIEPASLAEAR